MQQDASGGSTRASTTATALSGLIHVGPESVPPTGGLCGPTCRAGNRPCYVCRSRHILQTMNLKGAVEVFHGEDRCDCNDAADEGKASGWHIFQTQTNATMVPG